MPLTKNEDCGTNVDGSINYDYCKYCYAEGKFLQDSKWKTRMKWEQCRSALPLSCAP